jgi:hypothetical protein
MANVQVIQRNAHLAGGVRLEMVNCRRRFKSEPPRRSNIEPGVGANFEIVGCG